MRHRRRLTALAALALAVLAGLSGCAGTCHHHPCHRRLLMPTSIEHRHARAGSPSPPRARQPPLQALLTAQNPGRLLVLNPRSGPVIRAVRLPGAPGYVAAIGSGGPVVVTSSAAGLISILGGTLLHLTAVLHGFADPEIPALAPGGDYAYVTEGASGQLAVIRLTDDRVTSRTFIGVGAHHLAFSPNGQQVWVALEQSAATVTILSTVVSRPPPPSSVVADPGHPHFIARFHPGYVADDLQFSPDGRRVWITSANQPDVGVFSARTHRLLFRVSAGPPPQHVAFDGPSAYITSGYGRRIERVSLTNGRVLNHAPAPYGSFNLDAAGGYVVTSSLLRGTLATYNPDLRPLRVRHIAPSAEDVLLYQP
jgi:DNA-binding beta-propeller fold protein YncE